MHAQDDVEGKAGKTVVILQDSCYGHRYSRPRTSKANLSTIVERPERIHASVLGISAAYIRLGGRHANGRHPPHPKKHPKTLPTLPFRIQRSSRSVPLSNPVVTQVHGAKWMEELTAMCRAAETKLALNGKELTRPEMGSHITEDEKPRLHEGDLYLCSDSLDALQGCIGAVCDGVDQVFKKKGNTTQGPSRAFVCIRPPGHHCSSSYPSGFCWLNNVHVGITHAAMAHGLTHAAIIDFDLHHGDGSQTIAWEHNSRAIRAPKNASAAKKTAIGYFSVHDINSYPCEMGDEEKVRNASLCLENAHGQTIWNVHLQPWKHDLDFWQLYSDRYSVLLEKARAFLRHHTQRLSGASNQGPPKAAIFLSAGFDASEWEGQGMQRHKVNVPTDFFAKLTSDVVKLAEEEGLGVDGRIISVLEGGYSDRALCSGVLSHLSGLAGTNTTETGGEVEADSGLGLEMRDRIGPMASVSEENEMSNSNDHIPFDSKWWALRRLEELEELVNPPPAPLPAKKPKSNGPPTYATPTQSFAAKVVSSPKARRTSSMGFPSSPKSLSSRPPSPPPPEVDWATAAHELSKLLIPSDRQTKSHKPEELSAEASRAKRDRERRASISLSADPELVNEKRMQLRTRNARAANANAPEDDAERPLSRADRRKTVAGASLIADNAAAHSRGSSVVVASRRRRSSTASIGSALTDISYQSKTMGVPRTTSSMGTKSTNANIPARKPRVPSSTRAEPVKGRGLKKQPAMPSLPSDVSASLTGASALAAKSENGDRAAGPTEGGLDEIANSMKKMTLKLNVPTKEEHEAREKEKAAKTRAPVKTTRKAPAPKTTKAAAPRKVSPKNNRNNSDNSLPPTAQPPVSNGYVSAISNLPVQEPVEDSLVHMGPIPQGDLPTSITAMGPPPTSLKLGPSDSPPFTAEFVPYTHQPHEPPPSLPQQPLVWLDPNTGTPQPAKRGDLPIFTSSSPIPFGKPSSLGGKTSFAPPTSSTGTSEDKHEKDALDKDVDIWAVPETPVKK